jgi:stage III sporulation protein AG
MKNRNYTEAAAKIWEKIKKNKYVVAVLLIGVILIAIPTSLPTEKKEAAAENNGDLEFSLRDQEARIAAALSKIEGAGTVSVVLTLKSGTEQVLAVDEKVSGSESSGEGEKEENSIERSTSTVIIQAGGSTESPITLKYIYPEYLGALVIAEGADNAAVKLQLIKAVAGLTGLGTNKIIVTKMKIS